MSPEQDPEPDFEEGLREAAADYFEARLSPDPPTADEWAAEFPQFAPHLLPLLEQVDLMFAGALEGPPAIELPVLIDDYELTDVLGAGSFATVYLARDLRHDRRVAVKILDRDPGPFGTRDAQFVHDRRVAAAVRHPGIVSLYDSGICGDYRYLVMELGQHGTLRERLEASTEVWDFRSAARFIATLARAVAAAHDVGIIHRDIKPSNILIDADGHPKLTDFGLALDTRAQTLERYGKTVAGFPPYVAPEIRSQGIGAASVRSDVYSLGVLLHRLVYGRLPEEDVEPATAKRLNRVPLDLKRIIARATSSDAQNRPATAVELADELDRFLQSRPLRLDSTSPWHRVALWMYREPFQVGLVAMLLLAVASGAWAAWNIMLRQEEKTIRAELESDNRTFRERLDDETERAILAEVQTRYRSMVPNRRQQVRQRLQQMIEVREVMGVGEMPEAHRVQIRSLYSQSLALPDFVEGFRRSLPAYDFDYWRVSRHPQTGDLVVGLHDQVAKIDEAPTDLMAIGPQKKRRTPIFSPLGNYLAVMLPTGGWELRESQSPYALLRPAVANARPLLTLWISPDDQRLCTIDETGRVECFDLSSGEPAVTQELENFDRMSVSWTTARWSATGSRLILGSSDGRVFCWDRIQESLKLNWTQSVAQGSVDALAVASDGKVAVGTHDGRVHVLDSQGNPLKEFEVSPFGVAQIVFSSNSQFVFSGMRNVEGRGWDLETGEEVLRFDGIPFEISADDRVLTFGGWSSAGWIEIKPPEGMLKLGDHQAAVCRTCWSADGNKLASLDSDGRVVVRDLESGKTIVIFEDGPADYYAENTGLALSEDGRFLATVSGGTLSVARIRHVQSGATLLECRLPDGFERLVSIGRCEFLLVRQERCDRRQLETVTYRLTLRGIEDRTVLRKPLPGELGFIHAELASQGRYLAWYGPRYPEANRRWEIWDLQRSELLFTHPTPISNTAIFSGDLSRVQLPAHVDPVEWNRTNGMTRELNQVRLLESPQLRWYVADYELAGERLASVYSHSESSPITTLHHELPGPVATSISMDPTGRRLALGRTGETLVVVDVPVLEAAIRRDFPQAFETGNR